MNYGSLEYLGDLPILLVKIKDVNDSYIIEDVLKAYEFFRSKNIKIDLVILNGETNSYENFLRERIESMIQNKQLLYMKNTFGGIFTINKTEIKEEELELLDFRANLIIDSSLGNIDLQINDLEEEYLKQNKKKEKDRNNVLDIPKEELKEEYLNLKYYNEYGGFSEDGFEYRMKISKDSKLPTVWSNILANPKFGTVVTQNLGGFTWRSNSRLNRITAWNNSPSIDIPSEIIYIENKETGHLWNLAENLNKNNQEYHITYGFGYVKLKTITDEVLQELETFVAKEDSVKINILKLKNTSDSRKKLKIVYYIKPVLGEDEIHSNGYIDVVKEENTVYAKNLYRNEFKNDTVFVNSSEKIKSYTGRKEDFIGENTILTPEGLLEDLDNRSGLYQESCIAIQLEIELEEYGRKEIILNLGAGVNKEETKRIASKYLDLEACKEELKSVKQFWYELVTEIQVKTPLESMNLMMNGWAIYQTITSRLWAKSGYYQSGGAIGFRDQLQDTLGIKYIKTDLMKKQILKQAAHQFIEGDVEHWWHEETNRGIRTRFSDDLLWLCYVVNEYIGYTGDYDILDEEIPYLAGKVLEERRR